MPTLGEASSFKPVGQVFLSTDTVGNKVKTNSLTSKNNVESAETKNTMSTINTKTQANTSKISKIDVSGMKSLSERFIKKASRYLNFLKLVNGFFNAHTIMRGASKNWDPVRLQEGKHALFAKIGAEHVQLKSKTGDKVDGHFLSAASFIQKLEGMGGKRSMFELEIKDSSIYTGKKCHLEIDGEFPVEMMEISLNEEQLTKDKYYKLRVEDQVSAAVGEQIKIIQDSKTGKFYAIDLINFKKLCQLRLSNFEGKLTQGTIKELDQTKSLLPQKIDFPVIKFDKQSSQWKEMVKILADMKIGETTWDIKDTNDTVYLIPRKRGDEVVPKHHPEAMIDAMQDNPNKIITLSMNPGASHITDWWDGHESQDTVLQFLKRTGLSQSLFE